MKRFTSELAFQIGERVKISELNKVGFVVSVWIQMTGKQYEVRYFDNAERRQIYFFEDELTSLQQV